jgi:hypothetical protein
MNLIELLGEHILEHLLILVVPTVRRRPVLHT